MSWDLNGKQKLAKQSVQGAFQAEEQIRERARGEVEEEAQSLVAEWWAKDRV